jgi:hypothetical protein
VFVERDAGLVDIAELRTDDDRPPPPPPAPLPLFSSRAVSSCSSRVLISVCAFRFSILLQFRRSIKSPSSFGHRKCVAVAFSTFFSRSTLIRNNNDENNEKTTPPPKAANNSKFELEVVRRTGVPPLVSSSRRVVCSFVRSLACVGWFVCFSIDHRQPRLRPSDVFPTCVCQCVFVQRESRVANVSLAQCVCVCVCVCVGRGRCAQLDAAVELAPSTVKAEIQVLLYCCRWIESYSALTLLFFCLFFLFFCFGSC